MSTPEIAPATRSSVEADGPRRIQRQRSAGWRMPEGAIYVGRGTPWGNPFRVYEHCKGRNGDWGVEDTGRFNRPLGHGMTREGAARLAVIAYRRVFDEVYPEGSTARSILVGHLQGHDLACWCRKDQPCHADVLIEVANPPASSDDTD